MVRIVADNVNWRREIHTSITAFTHHVAENALRQAVSRGFDPRPLVVTDGIPRRDPAQVKPFGKIEYIAASSLTVIAMWIMRELERLSPVRTGRYKMNHIYMVNGAQVRTPRDVKPGERIQIVNTVPYAKKIEGRKASRARKITRIKPLSNQAKGGVYRKVEALAKARFGRQVSINFLYVALNLGQTVMGFAGGGKNRKRVVRDAIYPCIRISPLRVLH